MQNCWYADNRDLVKWSILMHLADMNSASCILQIAYFQECNFPKVELDSEERAIPEEVLGHFRDIGNIKGLSSSVRVEVFDKAITDRERYLLEAKEFISRHGAGCRCVVFLDPDTGLESTRPSFKHVLRREANDFWKSLKAGDTLAIYQHQTNRNGKPWQEPKRIEFEKAIGVPEGSVKVGCGLELARDVVLFYVVKT